MFHVSNVHMSVCCILQGTLHIFTHCLYHHRMCMMCVRDSVCVCVCMYIYIYSEQVYRGISYLCTDVVCVCIYIHTSLDNSPHYTDSDKDIYIYVSFQVKVQCILYFLYIFIHIYYVYASYK